MKKLIVLVLTAVLLTGCEEPYKKGGAWLDYSQLGSFKNIEADLFYDSQTGIVYVIMTDATGGYRGFGFMSPYISENGKFCRYNGEKIVEVNE